MDRLEPTSKNLLAVPVLFGFKWIFDRFYKAISLAISEVKVGWCQRQSKLFILSEDVGQKHDFL
jgi:hypothetical protein